MKTVLIFFLLSSFSFGQKQNAVWTGTVDARSATVLGALPGVLTVSPVYGDGIVDATASIQAALNNSLAGTIVIPPGNYLFSDITIPSGKLLLCSGASSLSSNANNPGTQTQVTTLTYTGSGVAIQGAWSGSPDYGTMSVQYCNIIKQGAVAGTAIRSRASLGSYFFSNTITGFTNGILLDGNFAGGSYNEVVSRNHIDKCTNGITSTGSGANTINSVTISDNGVQEANIGIYVCAVCRGWKIDRNDVECPTGTTPFNYKIDGDGNFFTNNWVEYNQIVSTCANPGTNMTGLAVNGTRNYISGVFPQQDSGGVWTNYTVAVAPTNGNETDIGYDNSTGALSSTNVFYGRRKVTELQATNIVYTPEIASTGTAPTLNVTSCAGAAIGANAGSLGGTITGLPTGTCTIIMTLTVTAASHGWSCSISNQTTANLFRQTASNTTTVTFSGTSVSGDVLSYGPCVAW